MAYVERLDAPQESNSCKTPVGINLVADKSTALAVLKSAANPEPDTDQTDIVVPNIPDYSQSHVTATQLAASSEQVNPDIYKLANELQTTTAKTEDTAPKQPQSAPAKKAGSTSNEPQVATTNPMSQLQKDSTSLATAEATLTKDTPGSAQFTGDEHTLRTDSEAVVVDMQNTQQLHPSDATYNNAWQTARTDLADMNSDLWNLENRPTNSSDYTAALAGLATNEPKFQSDLPAVYKEDAADDKPASDGLSNVVLDVPSAAAITDAVKAGLSFGSVRLWDDGVKIDQLEKDPNAWGTLGNLVSTAHDNNKQVMYTFGNSGTSGTVPTAASIDALAKKLAQWSANEKKPGGNGGIDTYELWNEPNASGYWKPSAGDDWTQSATELANINAIMIKDIKEYDPTAKIASPALSFDTNATGVQGIQTFDDTYFSQLSKDGLLKDINQVDFHGYTDGSTQTPEQLTQDVAMMKQIKDTYGLSSDPLVDSEDSFGKDVWNTDPQTQADYLARKMILSEFSGVTPGYYGYGFSTWGTLTADGKPGGASTPAMQAYEQADKWLDGAQLDNLNHDGDVWTATLMRDGEQETIAWAENGTAEYTPSAGYTQYQTLGGETVDYTGSVTLTGQPILLES
ncbi:MAG TPA: hypothetical protein V6C81_04725 [Planktothrix sp.]|jgi:hypothetical protein